MIWYSTIWVQWTSKNSLLFSSIGEKILEDAAILGISTGLHALQRSRGCPSEREHIFLFATNPESENPDPKCNSLLRSPTGGGRMRSGTCLIPSTQGRLRGTCQLTLSKITPMTPSQSHSCFSHLCSTCPSLTCLSIFILQENVRGRILFILLIPESPVPVGAQMHICWVKVSKGKNQMREQTKPHSCFPVP